MSLRTLQRQEYGSAIHVVHTDHSVQCTSSHEDPGLQWQNNILCTQFLCQKLRQSIRSLIIADRRASSYRVLYELYPTERF